MSTERVAPGSGANTPKVVGGGVRGTALDAGSAAVPTGGATGALALALVVFVVFDFVAVVAAALLVAAAAVVVAAAFGVELRGGGVEGVGGGEVRVR